MQTKVNKKLVEFDNFSKAFKHVVDIILRKGEKDHVDLYEKIDMDKSQWSKLYGGNAKNPRPSTIAKLSNVVGYEFERLDNGKWIVKDKNENTINTSEPTDITHETEKLRAFAKELDKVEEPSLDYVRELRRIEDIVHRKIQKALDGE